MSEVTYDENGKPRPKHESLIKAEKSILRLLNDNTLFTYLDEELIAEFKISSTNKSIDNIYKKMTAKKQLENTIPMWGDAVVWSELHRSSNYPVYWD